SRAVAGPLGRPDLAGRADRLVSGGLRRLRRRVPADPRVVRRIPGPPARAGLPLRRHQPRQRHGDVGRGRPVHRLRVRVGGQRAPEQLDADPLTWLGVLSERVAGGLLDMADADRPEWLFPPPPEAFQTNTTFVAYGAAGVVHALHTAGVPIPDDIEKRLR